MYHLMRSQISGPENVVVEVATGVIPDSQIFDPNMWRGLSGWAGPGVGCGEGVQSGQHTQAQGQATRVDSTQVDARQAAACQGGGHLQAGLPTYNDSPQQTPSSSTNPSTQAVPHSSMRPPQVLAPTVPAGIELTWGLSDPNLNQPGYEWPENFDQETATTNDCPMNPQDEVATQPRPITIPQLVGNDISAPVAGPSSFLPAHDGGSGQVGLAMWRPSHQEGWNPEAIIPLNPEAALPQPGSERDVNRIYDFEGGDSWNMAEQTPSWF